MSYKKNVGARRAPRREDEAHFKERPRSDELDENVVIGRNAVRELLADGRDVDKIYITSGDREGSINLLLGIAGERGIPIFECDKAKLDSIARGGRHR